MYRGENVSEGRTAHFLRDPGEVLDDILSVRERIVNIRERTSLRELLPELFTDSAGRVSDVISQLEGALAEAESSLYELHRLEGELASLEGELYEIRCERGH